MNFAKGARQRVRGWRGRGDCRLPMFANETNILCVRLRCPYCCLLLPHPPCYSIASPFFLAINSLYKFGLCCIIKKLNSFFFISFSLFLLKCNLDFFNLELEWKLFARLMRSRLAGLSLDLSHRGGGSGESRTGLKIYIRQAICCTSQLLLFPVEGSHTVDKLRGRLMYCFEVFCLQ